VDKACKALAAFIPGDPEWDRVAIVERSLQILVDLRREVSAKNVATNAAAAATLSAQLASEIAESNACRLAAAVADAQLHVDGLLQHAARLQDSLNRAQATNQETENALREKEHRLSSSIAELQATRQELARYESRLICRLAARPSSLLPARTP
jgi:ABC-type transporter Mla subunit MlaD